MKTGQQCAPLQPLDVEFDWSNEEWSRTFLPLIRLAVVAVQKDERSFEIVLQEWMDSGVIDEALERWLETAEHLDGLTAVLNCVLARSAKVLRKIGVEPVATQKSGE
jgi:hypothetical protein